LAQVVREYGAPSVTECWLDEEGPEDSSYHGATARPSGARYGTFAHIAAAQADETVVLSWVEWPDIRSRDAGMARLSTDPRMRFDDETPVFDGARLIAGGLIPIPLPPVRNESA
jgi:uncharacterized protein YbaA (DUF1428 family)